MAISSVDSSKEIPIDPNGLKEKLPSGLILDERWELEKHIASGGKGDVYLAKQINLNRQVAIKVISPDFVKSLEDDPEELETEKKRFRREVLLTASLQHPNVLQVYDNGIAEIKGEKLEYLVMEYIPGKTLRSRMELGGFQGDKKSLFKWIANYFIPILKGVETCHEAGVIHRDLKPENVLMSGDTPKITDFGLARDDGQDWNLTHTAHILGTIFYMPKEQFEDGAATDERADIYALSKMLYEAVCGKITNESKLVFKEVGLPLQDPLFQDSFFQKLDKIIREGSKEEHDERTASVKELREKLEGLLEEVNIPQFVHKERKVLRYSILALILLVLGLFFLHLVHPFTFLSDVEDKPLTNKVPASQPEMYDDGRGGMFHLVPAGLAVWQDAPDKPERSENLKLFYIRTSLVSNSQYIEFLNSQADLRVENNKVFKGDTLWLLLGGIKGNYEPIVYADGKFSLGSSVFGNADLVNVTLEGALAFAFYYDQSLPKVSQWTMAKNIGALPVGLYSGQQPILGEWMCEGDAKDMEHYIIRPTTSNMTTTEDFPLPRQSWETFKDIGFRTVKNIDEKN